MKDPCYFGYQQVELEAKQGLVNQVFHSVANRYDIMNDLMSFGIHRLWKRETLARSGVRPKDYVLDLASGTGDLARLFVKAVGKEGLVIASDINPSMLAEGRERFENEGLFQGLGFALINAETLPFSSNQFDVVS
ncbi:MAG: methyltransferase domain-containing protein, partial [Gammaproteobacteria bacterium]|nr:methyltransferase domain-containing protein [Gammaproteobacteria bacterium]